MLWLFELQSTSALLLIQLFPRSLLGVLCVAVYFLFSLGCVLLFLLE